MASITKIKLKTGKSSWRVHIRLRSLKPITKQFHLKSEAIAFARKIEGDYSLAENLGKYSDIDLTLENVIEKYLSQYQKKDTSVKYILNFWSKEYGKINFSIVDAKIIRQGLNQVKRSGVAECTLNRYKSALSSVFEFAKEEFETKHNPCREIRAKPESKSRIRFLSNSERIALLTACKESSYDRLYLAVLFSITTGSRRGELLALKWSDIDFKNRLASLHDSKNGKPRELPLTGEVVDELKKFQEVGAGFIFPSRSGDPLTADDYRFRCKWNEAVKAAGINDFRFHDLRHTCASYLAQSNASLIQIAEVLGHSSTTVTKRYAHLCVEHKKSLINSVLGDVGL